MDVVTPLTFSHMDMPACDVFATSSESIFGEIPSLPQDIIINKDLPDCFDCDQGQLNEESII